MRLLAVNYHYFRENKYPSGIYPTSQAELGRQIDALWRNGYHFIGQADLAEKIAAGEFPNGKYCMLTFDDGLKEQMEAFRFLLSKGIPAVFYVSTDPIRHRTVLPTHQLHYIRSQVSDAVLYDFLEKNSPIAQYPFEEARLENQYRYDDPPARKIKFYLNFVLTEQEKTALIRQLFDTLAPDTAAFSSNWYMDAADLRILARAGALGSHGSAHLPLATLPEATAAHDIQQSIDYLETTAGCPIWSFSYPFGGATAVSLALGLMLADAGIRFAFTMQRGENREEQFRQPLFLLRVDTNDAPGGKAPLPIFT